MTGRKKGRVQKPESSIVLSESGSSDEGDRKKMKGLSIGAAQGSGGSKKVKKGGTSKKMNTPGSASAASRSAMEEEVAEEVRFTLYLK